MANSTAATLLPAVSFQALFKSQDGARDKFLARLFGLFNEQIVRVWASCEWAPYEDLGRPTLRHEGEARGRTLDFALQSRRDGRVFVAEMKCWLEYDNYRYLTLTHHSQLEAYKNEAFGRFLAMARNPAAYPVFVRGQRIKVSGAILVWGSATNTGKQSVRVSMGLHDVLTLEDIVDDLLGHDVPAYRQLLNRRAKWCEEMFRVLAGAGRPLNAER